MSRNQSDKPFTVDNALASDTFCILPWIHLHTNPEGVAAPCCIAESCSNSEGMGNSHKQRLMDLVNSPGMNQLRLDMLDGKRNSECNKCYQHEDADIHSNRKWSNKLFEKSFGDVANTNADGSLSEFTMRYYDVRFSNICNFKCRTCGQEYSSQWEQENLRSGAPHARRFPKNTNTEFLEDVLEHIPHMEIAYFAGGEPLITDEHYILLEEMIRQNKTDVMLRYNTNLSNLKFKNKDLLGLWKHFDHDIQLSASIDHVRERAEYIRHGTDWGVVENNFNLVRQEPNIKLEINTVLSVFNYLTIDKFYGYLINNNMYTNKDAEYSLYSMSGPECLSVHILPDYYKQLGHVSIQRAIHLMKYKQFNPGKINQLRNAHRWAETYESYWEKLKDEFKKEINRIDLIRNEDFRKTFPELAPILDL
jgi:organic radical activating enzyme